MKKILNKSILFRAPASGGNEFVVTKRDLSSHRNPGNEDKYSLYVIDSDNNVVKDWGSHPSLNGAKAFAKSKGLTEMRKYDLKKYLIETELKYSKEERNAFLESLRQFSSFKNEIYRSKKLKEIAKTVGSLIESAEGFSINETQNGFDFDSLSMNRDFKTIRENYKMFEKTCNEMHILQQRLESCYENIGVGLSRYYEV